MQQDQEPDSSDAGHVPTAGAAVLLSIGEAAAKLGTSPAYVTMLLDKGRLGEVVETPVCTIFLRSATPDAAP